MLLGVLLGLAAARVELVCVELQQTVVEVNGLLLRAGQLRRVSRRELQRCRNTLLASVSSVAAFMRFFESNTSWSCADHDCHSDECAGTLLIETTLLDATATSAKSSCL